MAAHARAYGDNDPLAWMALAKCKGIDDYISVFFSQSPKDAKDICASCSVSNLCLEYANDFERKIGWRSGIYGGTTPHERDKIYGRTSLGRRFKAEGTSVI